jgi:hypothetical protein
MVARCSDRCVQTRIGRFVESPHFASRILKHESLCIEAAMNREGFQTVVGVKIPADAPN